MPRSQGNPHPSLVSRILMFLAKRALGRDIPGLHIRAFDPKYFRRATRMDLYSAAKGTVPMHPKELAQIKVALLVGCPF